MRSCYCREVGPCPGVAPPSGFLFRDTSASRAACRCDCICHAVKEEILPLLMTKYTEGRNSTWQMALFTWVAFPELRQSSDAVACRYGGITSLGHFSACTPTFVLHQQTFPRSSSSVENWRPPVEAVSPQGVSPVPTLWPCSFSCLCPFSYQTNRIYWRLSTGRSWT